MDKCWICFQDFEKKDTVLLPDKNDYLGASINLPEDCYEIKKFGKTSFLYYNTCFNCLDNYLKIQRNIIKILRDRELGLNNKFKGLIINLRLK